MVADLPGSFQKDPLLAGARPYEYLGGPITLRADGSDLVVEVTLKSTCKLLNYNSNLTS